QFPSSVVLFPKPLINPPFRSSHRYFYYREAYKSKNGKKKRKLHKLDYSCVQGTNPIRNGWCELFKCSISRYISYA
ncbi:hypothetical protein MTR67_048681, partial [Solanum verrucosum]